MNKAQKALAKEAQEILAIHSLKERYWSSSEWLRFVWTERLHGLPRGDYLRSGRTDARVTNKVHGVIDNAR